MTRSFTGTAQSMGTRVRLAAAALFLPWPKLCQTARGQFASEGEVVTDVLGNVDPFSLAAEILATRDAAGPTLDLARPRRHAYFPVEQQPLEAWSSEPEAAEFLAKLVFSCRAVRVIEIGSFVGFTSCHIASSLEQLGGDGLLFCVDSSERYLAVLQANVDALGLSQRVRCIHGGSLDEPVIAQLPAARIIFIDSAHDYRTTAAELEVYPGKIERPGYVVLHDSIMWPGVRRAVAEFPGRKLTFATSRGAGLSVILLD